VTSEYDLACIGARLTPFSFSTVPIYESSRSLTQLRSLSLDFALYPHLHSALQHTFHIIHNLASAYLQELIVTLPSVKRSVLSLGFNSELWTQLCSLLETPQYLRTLHTLAFRFRQGRRITRPRAIRARNRWVEERFPLCMARGILQVD
jgi:hypothetical protein